MTRQQSLALTQRVLAHMATDTLDVTDDVWAESRDAFVSQQRLEADRRMFREVPQVVGWSGEVARPGSFTTKDVMGVPVLITRARDGQLRAFINGCAHRGAQVASGCGSAIRLSCPYHGWTYNLDGRLAGAPARQMFDGVDLESRALRSLPVSERGGLITVGLSPDVDVDSALDDVAEPLADYDYASYHHFETVRYDLAMNWKLGVDVNFEGYHFPYAHRDTLDIFVSNNSVFDLFGRHSRWAFPFRDLADLADKPQAQWPDVFHGTVVFGLFPSTVLVEASGVSQMLRIYPGDTPGRCVAYLTYGTPEPVPEKDRQFHLDGMEAAAMVLRDEDFPAAEACQRGIEAGVDPVVFGRNEPLLHHLAEQWQQALLGAHPVATA